MHGQGAEEEEDASGLAVQYQQLGLGRLTRKVSQRRRGSLAAHLRSIYLDAQVGWDSAWHGVAWMHAVCLVNTR